MSISQLSKSNLIHGLFGNVNNAEVSFLKFVECLQNPKCTKMKLVNSVFRCLGLLLTTTAYYSYHLKQCSSTFTLQRECNDLVELFTKTNMSAYHHSVQDLVSEVTFKKVESMLQVFDICLLMRILEYSDAQLSF